MPARPRRQRLTLSSIFASTDFDERLPQRLRWLADGRRLSFVDRYPDATADTVWVLDACTGRRDPVYDPASLRLTPDGLTLRLHYCDWSPCERYVLLTSEAPARFRPCGDIYLYDTSTSVLRQLTRSDAPQHHPAICPTGGRLAIVRANELWLVALDGSAYRRLTDGASDTVYNGRTGWVYEEELGLACTWRWSPDGRTIAYLQQDESSVPEVLLPVYDEPHATPLRTRYPKAGDANPVVRLGLLDVAEGVSRWVDLTDVDGVPPGEHMVAGLQWEPTGHELLVQRIPRLQNRLDLLAIDASSGSVRIVMTETDAAWVDAHPEISFVDQGRSFLWLSDRDGWQHVYRYDLDGGSCMQVTRGPWEVSRIAGVSTKTSRVLVIAAVPTPASRSVLAVDLDGQGEPERLTADRGCHTALVAPQGGWWVRTSSTLDSPTSIAIESLCATPSIPLAAGRPKALDTVALRPWRLFTITTSDGEELCARILEPPSMRPGRRYPALMHAYGGPGSQVVMDAWGGKGGLWHQMLAQRGYIVFLVDNRGTGGRGRQFRKCTYRRLGHWEVHDQVEGARYLQSLPCVDPARIGIWGWSYGGYVTALCMLLGAEAFRAGIAVAPVTDYRLYDTIYTERYMLRPADNPEGYRNGAPVTHASKLQGRLLLVHGTLDDNVHFQHAARLASALQDAGRPFETMFYPDRRHGIENRHAHLYEVMTDFLKRSL
ncbi:MAG TPA: DPP IV N-terminal domain-containing protein [Chthonomonadales bacterium]|nr:DPP IV N-terminal domain-containing protein [Chthonomonadales bacterium]